MVVIFINMSICCQQTAQSQLKEMRPRLEAVRSSEVRTTMASANGDSAKPRILRESEDLLSRFDALDANIDSWVGRVESASKQVKDFQVKVRSYLQFSKVVVGIFF